MSQGFDLLLISITIRLASTFITVVYYNDVNCFTDSDLTWAKFVCHTAALNQVIDETLYLNNDPFSNWDYQHFKSSGVIRQSNIVRYHTNIYKN